MINIVIDMLLSQKGKNKEKMSIKEKILFGLIVFVIFAPLTFLLVFLMDANKIYWGIISAVTSLVIPVVLFLSERNRISGAMDSYNDYNKSLDTLRDILIDLKYDSNGVPGNWYSKSKIRYLISECDKLLTENATKNKSVDFLKFMVVPIISFVAGVIADKAPIGLSLSFAVVAFLFALSIWGIYEIVKFLDDIILKSSSINTIKNVRDKLKDLQERDFKNEDK